MIDIGRGTPVVLVPGIKGRWQWLAAGVEALSARARVIGCVLCGEPGSGCRLDPALGFDSYVRQLDEVLDRTNLERAAVCGVSYGGLIALRYAARRPARVTSLVLVSTPGPAWRPDERAERRLNSPRLWAALSLVQSRLATAAELRLAIPRRRDRLSFRGRYALQMLRTPVSPTRIAERVRLALDVDFAADCRQVVAPTLVVTGEETLDRTVPTASTREYLNAIPGAQAATIDRTGHLGVITRPDRFARVVAAFADAHASAAADAP